MAALTLRAAELQDRAVRELAGARRSWRPTPLTARPHARGHRHIVAFLAAALYVEDERIMGEFVGWLREVLTTRGVPAAAVDAGPRRGGGCGRGATARERRAPPGARTAARPLTVGQPR
jgi:hypothetical protein